MRAELATLGRELAARTGAHLAAAAHFFDTDPERAWAHAVAARRRASRLGVVREAAGLAAYRAGKYAEALAELRTVRRITGSSAHLPVMADAERGLGRPERAIELAHSPEAATLGRDPRIELLIVESGARGDLGEHDAAIAVLQIPELKSPLRSPTLARLRFAYSEALRRSAQQGEADAWRDRAVASDEDGAADLYPQPDDEIVDLQGDAEEPEEDVAEPVEDVAEPVDEVREPADAEQQASDAEPEAPTESADAPAGAGG